MNDHELIKNNAGEQPVERHPLVPFLPENARVLFLVPELHQRPLED